jgi:hypothetical protein
VANQLSNQKSSNVATAKASSVKSFTIVYHPVNRVKFRLFYAFSDEMEQHAISSLHRYLCIHFTLLLADILITHFANFDRLTFEVIITLYILQIIFVMVLGVLFVMRFTNSFPFKAGMLQIMFRNFLVEIVVVVCYCVTVITTRAIEVVFSFKLGSCTCMYMVE